MRFFVFVFYLAVTAPAAALAEYESRILFSKGAWLVEITYDTEDDVFWCSARSTNRQSQTFSVTAYANSTMSIFFFDNRWDLSPRPVSFIIDVDYERWTVDGSADGIGISSDLSNAEVAGEFVGDLMQGNAVALYNNDERRLATFSLNGSAAAINELIDCWDKIVVPRDPFQTSQDPF